jgi:hypothetical protein
MAAKSGFAFELFTAAFAVCIRIFALAALFARFKMARQLALTLVFCLTKLATDATFDAFSFEHFC